MNRPDGRFIILEVDMRKNCLHRVAFAGALTGLAVFAAARERQQPEPTCPAIDPPAAAVQKALPSEASANEGGLRVFRDPVTGQIRQPTSEEAAAIARTESAEQEREPVFEVVTHPDGMQSVDLHGAFLQSVVAVRRPDGSVAFLCLAPGARPAAPPALPPPPPALEEK